MSVETGRQLTGRTVFAMFALGFGIIIAVNMLLAVKAVDTFPGLEVANSYVASQSFDARRRAQEALGWTITAEHKAGRLVVDLRDADGHPIRPGDLSLTLGRPTEEADDLEVALQPDGSMALELRPGLWRLDVLATAPDGTEFRKQMILRAGK
jgi:nitrogen fixation protein FixH